MTKASCWTEMRLIGGLTKRMTKERQERGRARCCCVCSLSMWWHWTRYGETGLMAEDEDIAGIAEEE